MRTLLKLVARLTLVAFVISSCSSAMNVRPEDYGRIDQENTYRVVMADGHEYKAHNLVVTDKDATFSADHHPVTVPLADVKLIQQVYEHEIMTGAVVLGIAALLTGGLVWLVKSD